MSPSRVRLVAQAHGDAGPLTRELARSGRILPGLSTELLDHLPAAADVERDELGALWEHVERTGPDGARSLRQLDADRRARLAAQAARVAS